MINLVDLAGSEKADQSKATGDRLQESVLIGRVVGCSRILGCSSQSYAIWFVVYAEQFLRLSGCDFS